MSADALRKAYYKTEEGFLQFVRRSWLSNPQIAISGSCCLAGTIYNGTLYIANLGDSRAVLGRRVSDDGVLAMPPVVAERLTSDHNVGNVKVRQEVRALHPDDKQILVYSRGYWRIKGIIQVLIRVLFDGNFACHYSRLEVYVFSMCRLIKSVPFCDSFNKLKKLYLPCVIYIL